MKDLASAAMDLGPLVLSGIIPFVRVLRGRSLGKSFLLCWALLVLSFFLFTFCFPVAVSCVDPNIGIEVFKLTPDTTTVGVSLFMGWFWAAIVVLPAWGIRAAIRVLKPGGPRMPPREEV